MANSICRFFTSKHLTLPLQEIAKPIEALALEMERVLPDSPEKAFGLRQLLLAKDAFIRAALPLNK